MPDKTWKQAERRVAAMFGCLRARLSGSSGRDDQSASDSTHATLFLETKYRERHAVRTLHEATRTLAKRERKTAVVALVDKGKPGALVCVHSDDLAALAVEYLAANYSPELMDQLSAAVKRHQGLDDDDF